MIHYDRSNAPCPKCDGETHQDSVDVGVGVIHGPRGCIECAWSEDPEYDLSEGHCPVDEKGGAIDQFGGYYPPRSSLAKACRMAKETDHDHT